MILNKIIDMQQGYDILIQNDFMIKPLHYFIRHDDKYKDTKMVKIYNIISKLKELEKKKHRISEEKRIKFKKENPDYKEDPFSTLGFGNGCHDL